MVKLNFHHYLRSLTPTLSVGITAANFMCVEEELKKLENTGVEIIHFDVMDGVFCPEMTVGSLFVSKVKTKFIKDVHLMVVDPTNKINQFVKAGADIITVHYEACSDHIHGLLQEIKRYENVNNPEREINAGVAINPGTPVECLKDVLDIADVITILAVNPGWPNQIFLKTTAKKVERAISLINESERDILLCIDGGITKENIIDVSHMAPDIVVAGRAIFEGNPKENAKMFLEILKRGRSKNI
ncbi:MAG: ribulose-phosphate 3-epimerase [Candidatus Omnitrophica bacterium]|nr:ribulose-phosphate 3-epimerase [Candidatus Omnitrophota bacterium]MCM8817255.1 ribulose-phosphate 3-epimerase [Candidatus Omnitrophota bacterium]